MQAERKRIDKMNKGMAERTIDAQRVSGERAWRQGTAGSGMGSWPGQSCCLPASLSYPLKYFDVAALKTTFDACLLKLLFQPTSSTCQADPCCNASNTSCSYTC